MRFKEKGFFDIFLKKFNFEEECETKTFLIVPVYFLT